MKIIDFITGIIAVILVYWAGYLLFDNLGGRYHCFYTSLVLFLLLLAHLSAIYIFRHRKYLSFGLVIMVPIAVLFVSMLLLNCEYFIIPPR